MKVIILHRNSYDLIGGVETTIFNMSKTLSEMGIDTIIIAQMQDGSKKYEQTEVAKVIRYCKPLIPKVLRFLAPTLYANKVKKEIESLLYREKPDLVIVRDNILSYVISQFFDNEKIVYVPLGIIKYYNKGIRKFTSLKGLIIELIRYIQLKQESHYQCKAFKVLKNLIVFSENMKIQVQKAIESSKNIQIVYPGVSTKFVFSDECTKDVHNEFGIPNDKKILLFVGRVVQEKNVRMLIEAYAKSNNSNTHLVIVGDGDDMDYVKNMAKDLHVLDYVTFTGYRRDAQRFYTDSSYLLSTSVYEAFGHVIIEAMASGTPTIGFKSQQNLVMTAIDELIEHGVNGFICEEFSVESLTKEINNAVSILNTEEYASMRLFCCKKAAELFKWDNFISEILKLTTQSTKEN